MKKVIRYSIFLGILLLAFIWALKYAGPSRKLDERITLRQKDKIPYGLSIANNLLPKLFPQAEISYEVKLYPVLKYAGNESHQAIIMVSNVFDVEEDQLNQLLNYVEKGNSVFLITRAMSYDALKFFGFKDFFISFNEDQKEDSLRVRLRKPYFQDNSMYTYPGKKFNYRITSFDTSRALVLGVDDNNRPNFIQLRKGAGSFYIHTAPLAFSNYFLLHKNNIRYYQNVMSVLPPDLKRIEWNEYYLLRNRNQQQQEPDWLKGLMKNEAFRWSFYTAIAALVLFVLLGMRRKQRMVPEYVRPKNDSLDFVKTVGRLYYERKDNKNLAEKIGMYFLEHVRSRYKISTERVDEELALDIHNKTGYDYAKLCRITLMIYELRRKAFVSEEELSEFYKEVETFYQTTDNGRRNIPVKDRPQSAE